MSGVGVWPGRHILELCAPVHTTSVAVDGDSENQEASHDASSHRANWGTVALQRWVSLFWQQTQVVYVVAAEFRQLVETGICLCVRHHNNTRQCVHGAYAIIRKWVGRLNGFL